MEMSLGLGKYTYETSTKSNLKRKATHKLRAADELTAKKIVSKFVKAAAANEAAVDNSLRIIEAKVSSFSSPETQAAFGELAASCQALARAIEGAVARE